MVVLCTLMQKPLAFLPGAEPTAAESIAGGCTIGTGQPPDTRPVPYADGGLSRDDDDLGQPSEAGTRSSSLTFVDRAGLVSDGPCRSAPPQGVPSA